MQSLKSTIPAGDVSSAELDRLGEFAKMLDGSPLAAGLRSLQSQIAEGGDVVLYGADRELSPHDAAKMLHVSRTFLLKVMDRGDLRFHRVGQHRRLIVRDIVVFSDRLHASSRTAAEDFAHTDRLAPDALDEMDRD